MALVPTNFKAGLEPLNLPSASGATTANFIMLAFQTYALAAQNSMGFPALSMPAWSAGKAQLQGAMSAPVVSGAMFAMNLTQSINTAWGSIQTQFQPGPIVANPGPLQASLVQTLSVPNPSAQIFILGLMNAVHTYCSTSIITGVIPGSPPVPFTGPPV